MNDLACKTKGCEKRATKRGYCDGHFFYKPAFTREWYREQEKIKERKREESKDRLRELLDSLGIEIKVEGCGCFDTPVFTLKHEGKVIVDEDNFNFDNLTERVAV